MRLSRRCCQSLRTNLTSRIFQPVATSPRGKGLVEPTPVPSQQLSKSQKLMFDMGIIRQSQNGIFHVLPFGMRALNKLKCLIDSYMRNVGAQEISTPLIVDSALWKKSGRWDTAGEEVFKLKDRHNKELLLNPTQEESVAQLMSSFPQLSHHQLPVILYQTSTKFRDELRPRCGLIRGREFLMTDAYSFDDSLDAAKLTYELVGKVFLDVFSELQLEAIKVKANPGEIGGLESHEYHICCDLGEDTLYLCSSCSHVTSDSAALACDVCQNTEFRKISALEVGHTFFLGDAYTRKLGSQFVDSENANQFLAMSSYGLGVSRILAACVESLSTDVNINWPYAIAPFKIVIIPAKEGSKEYSAAVNMTTQLYESLDSLPHLKDDVIIDDRSRLTIGKRVVHSQRNGYPYILVVGRKCIQEPPEIEIIEQAPNAAPFTHSLPLPDLLDYFTRRIRGSRVDPPQRNTST